jgi:hypothetical protein
VGHVRELRGDPRGIYVGRGPCPCRDPGCGHKLRDLGNPFPIEPAQPWLCMVRFLDMLEGLSDDHVAHLRGVCAPPARLYCWCLGRYDFCHGSPLARLGDGEDLRAIRADELHALGLPTEEDAADLARASRMRLCPACGGDGRRDPANNDARACLSCGGTGEVDS